MKIKDNLLIKVTNEDIVNGTLIIPNGVTEIGVEAFKNCTSLKSIKIPNSVTKIGISAFHGCTSLKSVEIPDGVKIGKFAFTNCTSLEGIKIPNGVMEIGRSTFNGCTSLKSVEIPDSVIEIGTFAFANCTSIENIKLPNSVIKIELQAFFNCISLKNVEIPNGVTSIGNDAFYKCTSLESITIPDSIVEIRYNAFSKCNNLNINILTSLFYFDNNELLNVNSITIYGKKINKNKFEQDLDNVRRKELLDKISSYLKNKNVTDKKCYELSEHKDFIEKTIYNLKNVDGYIYKDDFDKYMSKYILTTISMYDDKQMEQIFNNLNNYQETLDSSNVHSVVKYGSSLEQYPNYFAGILQLITNHYGIDSSMINMKKTIDEMSKPQNFIQLINATFDSYNGGTKYYLNKSALSKLEKFADVNITKLMCGIEKAEKLKVSVEVYMRKIDEYTKCLLSCEPTQVEQQSLLPDTIENPISIKEQVDEKIKLYQTHMVSMTSMYQQINNLISDYAYYAMKLKEVLNTLLPGVKMASSLGKGIIRTQKNIEMLEEILSSYKEMLKLSNVNIDNQSANSKGKV